MKYNFLHFLQRTLNGAVPQKCRLRLEALESRELLTATPFSTAADYDLPF